jgi:hypothetical protein
MKRILKYLLIILITAGCEEEIRWELNTREIPVIVVEGMITNERIPHRIILTRPVTELNAIPEPVSGAFITINDRDTSWVLSENPAGSGIYLTDSIRAVFGRIYKLSINIDSREYSAETEMVPVTALDSLDYSPADNPEGFYKLNMYDTDEPSMTEYYLDWSQLPGYTNSDTCRAKIIYYSLNTIDVGEMFKPEIEQVVFPAGTIVCRKKYSMNEAHAAFIRTLLSETEWRGGLFDVQPGNVQTNLSDGAIGYFSASTVIADSTIIMPDKK